jgi:hypothetical protein
MYIGKINNLKEKKMEANCNGNKIIKTQTKHVYKKKKVSKNLTDLKQCLSHSHFLQDQSGVT